MLLLFGISLLVETLGGSFSAVSTPIFASKYERSFEIRSIFQDLQDLHTFVVFFPNFSTWDSSFCTANFCAALNSIFVKHCMMQTSGEIVGCCCFFEQVAECLPQISVKTLWQLSGDSLETL